LGKPKIKFGFYYIRLSRVYRLVALCVGALVRVLSVVPLVLLSLNRGFVNVRGLTVPIEPFVPLVQNIKIFVF
jgi:hypothetical protein